MIAKGSKDNVNMVRQDRPREEIVSLPVEVLNSARDDQRNPGICEIAFVKSDVQATIHPAAVEPGHLSFQLQTL